MRVAPAGSGIEADFFERPGNAAIALFRRELLFVDLQSFGDDLAHRHAGAERAEGILEDDLQAISQGAHFAVGKGVDVLADEADAAL